MASLSLPSPGSLHFIKQPSNGFIVRLRPEDHLYRNKIRAG